ncbi:hypothetical protein JCM10212_002135, partial [Sporobolomyces blumeae]
MSTQSAKKPADGTDPDAPLPVPNLRLPQLAFVLVEPKAEPVRTGKLELLLQGIEQDEMAPYLSNLLDAAVLPSSPSNTSLLSSLRTKNEEKLKQLDTKLQDAEANLGETEVSDALKDKAVYLARIGEKEAALKAHDEAFDKTAGKGSKIDLVLAMIRIGFFHSDSTVISTNLERAQKLVDEGGDWDRRNRLKVYRGLHLLSTRNFHKGAELLIDAMPTFTATELIEYDEFVTLCVLSGVFALERKQIKAKIIDSPEVISVLPNVPTIKDFTEALYKTDYKTFFRALATVESTHFLPSKLLHVHAGYYTRELRIKAYAQLLESYRSVTLESLSQAFGVSKEWLDA